MAQALRATAVWKGRPQTGSRRARYGAGTIAGKTLGAYAKEPGVDPKRQTETLAEVVLSVNNWRWAGVPFILRSGKALADSRKDIVITFKPVPHLPTGMTGTSVPTQLHISLDPHQMLIVVLTRGSNDGYAAWNRSQAFTPTSIDPNEFTASERHRYYRLVLPMEPVRPLLSPHPLTWTTISHVIWDGMPAETLAAAQQEAMLDWLHWGGQIILVGGATPGGG